ncbi:unnamed protein product [Acanthoscelides obtectus]|uniref:Uncharacterized protein n=1 Tax=Acanthoscelides obtectus TaxID=200917 RepID=A0A9P0LD33_ACAOB|nr:unnamed protein product [Acanthoscelides obtectus]CAK1673337.1 hypothetical protein AOBTE_LOCUS29302 [Acanthoscelides obtectus]
MEIQFWDESQLLTAQQKHIYNKKHRELMKKCKLYVCLYLMTLISFFLIPLVSEGQALSFELYRPQFIPYYYQLLLNNMCGVLNTLFTILPTDMLFLCSITLTEIQFRLLGSQISQLFQKSGELDFEARKELSRCIRHHGFLLR